jgi:hypothetical protein
MKKLCVIFLIASGCASKPKTTPFDAKWIMKYTTEEGAMACLKQPDVERLRVKLIICEALGS